MSQDYTSGLNYNSSRLSTFFNSNTKDPANTLNLLYDNSSHLDPTKAPGQTTNLVLTTAGHTLNIDYINNNNLPDDIDITVSEICNGGYVGNRITNTLFSSNSYNGYYGNNMSCTFTYSLDTPGYIAGVTLSRVSSEQAYDTLVAFDGPSVNSKSMGQISNTQTVTNMHGVSSAITIRFTTDESLVDTGFFGIFAAFRKYKLNIYGECKLCCLWPL